MKIVTKVSDPPVITPEDIARIVKESDALSAAFERATASMEWLTSEDLRTVIKCS